MHIPLLNTAGTVITQTFSICVSDNRRYSAFLERVLTLLQQPCRNMRNRLAPRPMHCRMERDRDADSAAGAKKFMLSLQRGNVLA
ncbi:MAG: hypothetical protein R3E89_04845 [Thiolinea sp.]